jgi:hypothetical protein
LAALVVGADDAEPVAVLEADGADLGEVVLHRRADLGVVDPGRRLEDDVAGVAGAHAAEVLVEQVGAPLRLDVGQLELRAGLCAQGADECPAGDERDEPQADDDDAPPVAPAAETCEHGTLQRDRERRSEDRCERQRRRSRRYFGTVENSCRDSPAVTQGLFMKPVTP